MKTDTPRRETTSPIASVRGLRRTYGTGEAQVHALRGIDLDIPQGTFTAIMGPSGCGKSTLMHCLAGLDRADAGTLVLAGTELGTLDDDALTTFRRDRIGFVFQSFNLLPMLTAMQNILLPLELAGRPLGDALKERAHALAVTLGLSDRLGHRSAELSGGQRQRVAIARALIAQPDLLLADEPTGSLDSGTAAEILRYLRWSTRALGQTVVMVTHDPVAAGHADTVITMNDGRIA